MRLIEAFPRRRGRSCHDRPILMAQLSCQPLLNVAPELRIGDHRGHFGALGCLLGFPLSNACSVNFLATTGRSIAAKLSWDRAGITAKLTGHLTHAHLVGFQDRDFLTLSKRQISARRLISTDRCHPTSMPEPPKSNRAGHANLLSRLSCGDPGRDQPPKLPLNRAGRHRPTWGKHRRTQCPIRSPLPPRTCRLLQNPLFLSSHNNLHTQGAATTI